MDPTTCPTCGATVPDRTGAPGTCPDCGRLLPPASAPLPSTEESAWLRAERATPRPPVDLSAAVGSVGPAAPAPPVAPDRSVVSGPADDGATTSDAVDPSVRPPTVDRDALPEPDRDPLAGWDDDTVLLPERPTPDWLVVAAAGGTGLVAGALLAPRGRTGLGAVLGIVSGVVGAGIRRSVWRIEAPDGSWARLHEPGRSRG